jgi:tetratricopeptide (TPR) repeat protein
MSTPLEEYDACMELHRTGKIDEAKERLLKLTEEHSEFALAYNALGAILKKEGQIQKAIQYAEKYCELEPEDAFGFTVLSSFCIEAGLRDKAEDALMAAQDLRFKEHFTNET